MILIPNKTLIRTKKAQVIITATAATATMTSAILPYITVRMVSASITLIRNRLKPSIMSNFLFAIFLEVVPPDGFEPPTR